MQLQVRGSNFKGPWNYPNGTRPPLLAAGLSRLFPCRRLKHPHLVNREVGPLLLGPERARRRGSGAVRLRVETHTSFPPGRRPLAGY
jgi:hypothetical protein